MLEAYMHEGPGTPLTDAQDTPSGHACPAKDAYLTAVAEFDRLWNTSSSAVARDRMEQLLAVIVAFEEKPGTHPA